MTALKALAASLILYAAPIALTVCICAAVILLGQP
jgi:hypothetical protein